MMKKLLPLVLLALASCATPAGTPGDRVDWRCDAGRAFSVRLNAKGEAEVFAGGQLYHLPGVMAASGGRHTDGRVEYWEHHDEAMLNGAAGGPYENCRR